MPPGWSPPVTTPDASHSAKAKNTPVRAIVSTETTNTGTVKEDYFFVTLSVSVRGSSDR